MARPQVIAAPSVPAHPAAHDEPRYTPSLVALRAMRERLDARQKAALHHVEASERLRGTTLTNGDLMLDQKPAAKDVATRTALARRASFLLTDPIARDLRRDFETLVEGLTTPLDCETRLLLTAQVDALRSDIEAVGASAIESARRGDRCCPLTLQTQQFNAFLQEHRPVIDQVIAACGLPDPQRRKPLEAALSALAHDYLARTHLLPGGFEPAEHVAAGNHGADQRPVAVGMIDGVQSRSVYNAEWYGTSAVILIGIDDLVGPEVDPATASGTSKLHATGFEQCSNAHKQAGVFLQKLFVELVYLEEKSFLAHNVNKDGSIMQGAPVRTRSEMAYTGAVDVGDSLETPAAIGAKSQRQRAVATFHSLAYLSAMYHENHGQALLLDPQLHAWLHSPVFCRDTSLLGTPGTRLQLGGMAGIARALTEGGLLGTDETSSVAPNH